MAFVRCYTGTDGQSHFEDLDLLPSEVERSIEQAAASITFTRSPDGRNVRTRPNMTSESPVTMSRPERAATLVLAALFALRMFGMFVILPVFALYAVALPGGQDRVLVGIALGVYGLTQALLQIPFGYASDR